MSTYTRWGVFGSRQFGPGLSAGYKFHWQAKRWQRKHGGQIRRYRWKW